jgi:predicted phage terminase large subunit-like protein
MEEQLLSWDMSFKGLDSSDFVVGQVWGKHRADKFLLDQVKARLDFPNTLEAVRRLSSSWPEAHSKLVEDKANGSAVIATLKHEISGLIAVNPEGGKESRASAVSPQVESGNVYLPHPSLAPWVNGFIDECASFPNGAHDDQVDSMSQALLRWSTRPAPWFMVLGR